MTLRPTCTLEGCDRRVNRPHAKFCCPEHSQEAQRSASQPAPVHADKIASATRLVRGEETELDLVYAENIDLRNQLKHVSERFDEVAGRAAFERRLLEVIASTTKARPYKPVIKRPSKTGTSQDHEMVLLVSDAHYPEVVKPESAMGLEYNGDVCRSRMQHIVDATQRYIDLRESSYRVRKLTIAVLGDMVSGDIHTELEVSNEKPITESVVEMAHMCYGMGTTLAERVPVEMIFMPGNHCRTTQKPRFKDKWNNFEFLLGHLVKGLAGEQFKVEVPKDLIYMHDVFGKRIGMTHGDGVKSTSFAGIPFYGMRQRRDAVQSLMNSLGHPRVNLLAMGHFHVPLFWPGTDCHIAINGSLKGGDDYSLGTRYTSHEATQLLFTFHPDKWLTDMSFITFGDTQ